MYRSQKNNNNVVLEIYKDIRTVFRLIDIAMLVGETDFQSLNKKLNYYVRTKKLQNPRKGIYAKTNYNPEELACSIYSPAYISLEYVLRISGIIFQYDSGITVVSYLSRSIIVSEQIYQFRKIKGMILVNSGGIEREENHVNIASAERAFLDMLYLNGNYYFDNLNPLNKTLVYKLLPLYQSKALIERVNKLLKNDGY
ncbi:MAG: hypothetical protein KAS71_13300 [Bacteroidales bacterium]|nr:hypothetical protein [Bacteroidales bacterium]